MSFWTLPNVHPKTKSRFIVTFGTGLNLPNVKSVDKPSVEVTTKEYRLMNHFFNYPGIIKWQPIKNNICRYEWCRRTIRHSANAL